MVAEHSLLPTWASEDGDDPFPMSVKSKYERIRFAFDATDDFGVSISALAEAVGSVSADATDPAALALAFRIASEHAGVPCETVDQPL
jgi:hypothetical protein